MYSLIAVAFNLALFFVSFLHLPLTLAVFFAVVFLALYVQAKRNKETLKQEVSGIFATIKVDASTLTADIKAKLYALENGGHLASGTTSQVIASATPTPAVKPASPITT